MDEDKVVTGVMRLDIHLPASRSLKDKRQPIRSLRDRIRTRFGVSVCEYGNADLWQRCHLAFAMVATGEYAIRETFNSIVREVERRGELMIVGKEEDYY